MVNENIHEDALELLAGIPVEPESNEEWRKARYSCSGSGRIEKKFDLILWNLNPAADDGR